MNSKTSQTIRRSRSLQAGLLAAALITGTASAQNVGIGTTAPKSKLSVNGTTASGGIAVGDATYTSTTGTVAPLNGALIQGFTGIGTTNPIFHLHVEGDGSAAWDSAVYVNSSANPPTGTFAPHVVLRASNNAALSPEDIFGRYIVQSLPGGAQANATGWDAIHRGFSGGAPLTAMRFLTSGGAGAVERMRIAEDGDVGIGTAAPLSRLDVRGTTKVMATAGPHTGNFWNGTANVNGFEVTTNIGGDVFVGIQRAGAVAPLHLAKPAGAAVGDPFALFIVNAANVGTITRTAGGVAFNTTSDERLKEHIRPSAKGLKDVMKIQVSDYNYKSAPGRDETGFIAQQLNTILPEAVAPGGENPVEKPWAVDYGRVTPVLAKAIQEQQALIGSLKAEVATLADENRQLTAQVATVAALAAKMEALEKLVQTNTGESRTAMISK